MDNVLPPQIPDSEWLDLVRPTTLREGKSLAAEAGAVSQISWRAPILSGKVVEGARTFLVSLDLRSRTIPRADCACEIGVSRQICRHALAVYFAYFAPLLKAAEIARHAAQSKEKQSVPAATEKPSFPRANLVPTSAFPRSGGVPAPIGERGGDVPPPDRVQLDGGNAWLSVILPSREHPRYAEIREILAASGFVLDARSRRWFLRDEHKMLNFLAAHRHFLLRECKAAVSRNFHRVLQRIGTAEITCKAREIDGGFDFSVRLETRGVSENEVASAIACGRNYVRQKNGKIILLPEKRLRQISALRERLGQGRNAGTENAFFRRLSRAELPAAESALEELGIAFQKPETWKKRSAALRDLSRLARPPVPAELFSRLRIYQQIGAAWLWFLHKNELGGLLADEMGLGKTVQAIAYLAAVFESEPDAEPSLLVVPAGLIENWRRELARFAPGIPVRVHHGQKRAAEARAPFPRGIVLTSYATLSIDIEFFRLRSWHSIIADEAQQIKNRRSRNARSLKELPSRTRFVLTGTPIENSPDDLRSLFEFLMPGILPPRAPSSSTANFSVARRERLDENLKKLVAPYILRRTKTAVAPELPPRIEQTIWCRFGDAQSALYNEWKTRSREEIFKLEMAGATDSRLRIAAFSQLLRLRQICTEPRVLSPDFPEEDSAKLRAFRELLDEARAGGHRMLVFSQFVSVLDFLEKALRDDDVPFCRIDGSTRERQRECDRFNASLDIPVFLISLKAGGLGLNLAGADMVVHYDPWWNPAAEAQATDRAHRIGQTRTVTAIKLIVADSVEERVLHLQREKRHLLEELFEAGAAANAKISLAEIKELFE